MAWHGRRIGAARSVRLLAASAAAALALVGAQVAHAEGTFERPVVSGISPNDGPVAGGTTVTITGQHLEGAEAVAFGSTPASGFTVESSESISAVVPAGSGAVDVTVTTPGGTSATGGGDQFTYVPPPVIERIGGKRSHEGFDVFIEGSGFSGASAVDFGSTPATSYEVQTSKVIEATVPPGEGVVNVTVTTPAGGTSEVVPAGRFHYESGAPEFGRCILGSPPRGGANERFGNTSCTKPSGSDLYEWEPEALAGGFTAKAPSAKFESTGKVKVTCKAVQSGGSIRATKYVSGLVLSLAGCVEGNTPCTSPGAASGEVVTSALEGRLGWQVHEQFKKTGIHLYPSGHSDVFTSYSCGASTTTLEGSVVAAATPNKMLTTTVWKLLAKEGKQQPEALEGGAPDVLKNSMGEQVGLTTALSVTTEEALEISTVR